MDRLIYEGFSCVNPEVWKKLVSRVEEEIEDHYWERDGLFHTKRHEIITHLGNSPDDSSASSDDSSSEAGRYVASHLTGSYERHTTTDLPAKQNIAVHIFCTAQHTMACIRATK